MKLVREFYSEQKITRKPPFNLKAGDEVYFGATNYTVKQSGLYTLKNALVTPLGIIYKHLRSKKDFIICYEGDFKRYKIRYLLKTLLKFKRQKLDKHTKYLVLFDNYSGPKGFAHWLCDGLTRIAEINDELHYYTAVFPAYFKREKLYHETLSFFNFKEIIYLEENTLTKIPKLYIPSYIAGTGNFNPKNIQKLRDIVLPQIKSNRFDHIYISRAKAGRRFVINENEVCEYLKSLDFKVLYFEEYSFREQLEIISNAKIVISPHGAALSCIMFMKKDSHVLEFRKKSDSTNNMYYSLADAVGVNYFYLQCDYAAVSGNANNFNLKVDIVELKRELEIIYKN